VFEMRAQLRDAEAAMFGERSVVRAESRGREEHGEEAKRDSQYRVHDTSPAESSQTW
jgi:hypothetical protein